MTLYDLMPDEPPTADELVETLRRYLQPRSRWFLLMDVSGPRRHHVAERLTDYLAREAAPGCLFYFDDPCLQVFCSPLEYQQITRHLQHWASLPAGDEAP